MRSILGIFVLLLSMLVLLKNVILSRELDRGAVVPSCIITKVSSRINHLNHFKEVLLGR